MLIDKRLRISCNGAIAEAVLPSNYSSWPLNGSTLFGRSNGNTLFDREYPLVSNFPGSVVESP
jgi:hypothetical protein